MSDNLENIWGGKGRGRELDRFSASFSIASGSGKMTRGKGGGLGQVARETK